MDLQVRVINGNPFEIHDRYDGVPVVFMPGKPTTIPLEAAVHFFAMPFDAEIDQYKIEADFAHVARRYGWNAPPPGKQPGERPDFEGAMEKAKGYFAKLTLLPVRTETREIIAGDDALPPPRIRGGEHEERPAEVQTRHKRKGPSPKVLAALAKGRAKRRAKLQDAERAEAQGPAEPAPELLAAETTADAAL